MTEADAPAPARAPFGEARLRRSASVSSAQAGASGEVSSCEAAGVGVPAVAGIRLALLREPGFAPVRGGVVDQAQGKGIWWMPWH